VIALLLLAVPLLLGVLFAGFGLYHAVLGLDAAWQIIVRKTSPIGALQGGPCEVAGAIESETPLVQGGKKLAIAQAQLSFTSGKLTRTERVQRCAPGLSVRDATGVCLLLTEHVSLSAGHRSWSVAVGEVQERFPLYAEAALTICQGFPATSSVDIIEQTIELGDQVLVSGSAVADPEAVPRDYRVGGHVMVLTGHADELLLVAAGPEVVALARALLPAVLLGALSLAYLVLLAWMGWVGLLLWWLRWLRASGCLLLRSAGCVFFNVVITSEGCAPSRSAAGVRGGTLSVPPGGPLHPVPPLPKQHRQVSGVRRGDARSERTALRAPPLRGGTHLRALDDEEKERERERGLPRVHPQSTPSGQVSASNGGAITSTLPR